MNHVEKSLKGKRAMIQANEPFTYQGETLGAPASLEQNGKSAGVGSTLKSQSQG